MTSTSHANAAINMTRRGAERELEDAANLMRRFSDLALSILGKGEPMTDKHRYYGVSVRPINKHNQGGGPYVAVLLGPGPDFGEVVWTSPDVYPFDSCGWVAVQAAAKL